MKKRLTAVFVIIMAAFATLAAALQSDNGIVEENVKKSEISTVENVSIDTTAAELMQNDMHIVLEQMRSNGAFYDEIKKALEHYTSICINYELLPEERERLVDMAINGYDFTKVLQIYDFLKLTELGIDALEDIYLLAVDNNSEDAVEAAYAMYTNTMEDELSIIDVAHYVKKGITPEEIVSMYEITLKGNKKLKEALNEYVSGKSWSEIVSEAYNLPVDSFGEKATPHEIATIKNVAIRTNKNIEEIISFNENARPVPSNEAMEEFVKKEEIVLKEIKNLPEFEKLDTLIEEELNDELYSITSVQAKRLLKEGYSIREMKNAETNGTIKYADDGTLISLN